MTRQGRWASTVCTVLPIDASPPRRSSGMTIALARIALAVGGGWLLANAAGMGLDGLFIGVALGITAYGVVTAASVRPGVWPGGRP